MKRNIIVTIDELPTPAEQPVEIVERKGMGHPDTLCDGMAEEISVAYTRWCLENAGTWLHHNFDKVQLVAGQVDVRFGGGEMLKPIHIQIAGRGTHATPDGRPVPIDTIAIQAARQYLGRTMRYLDPDRHCVIDCFAGRGAMQLVRTVEHVTANDTSVGVAHWPLSPLEHTVYDTCQAINHELSQQYPVGEDVKVMAVRLDGEVTLTVAVPFVAEHVSSLAEYRRLKAAVQQAIAGYATQSVTQPLHVHLNMADDEASADVYLTLTGTSAECGDDGAVGRGNRVTGLIAPFRPNSLEATAGKNAISHVGKLYNVLALAAAKEIVAQIPEVRQAQVAVLSQIGQPLDQPLVAMAAVRPAATSLSRQLAGAVEKAIDHRLSQIDSLRHEIIRGERNLF